MKRKAQTSEFIGIAMMVVILTLIVVFNRLGEGNQGIMQTEEAIEEYNKIFITTTATKFPYITEMGVSLSELMGVLLCYSDEIADYGGRVGEINITEAIGHNLDLLYDAGRWKIELDNQYCITSDGLIEDTCGNFGNKRFVSYDFAVPLPCRPEILSGKIYILTE